MFYFVFYHQGSKEITVNSLIASPDSIPMNPFLSLNYILQFWTKEWEC